MYPKKKAKIEELHSSSSHFSSYITTLLPLLPLPFGLCIQGRACSGKSSIFHSLSTQSSNPLLTVYIDSSIDSKNLIGTYVCSEIPGEFLWKTGILAHAAETGSWILFENIDRMSEDIYSLLTNTILTQQIQVPNKNTGIIPAPGFKILATSTNSLPESSAWVTVHLPALDQATLWQLYPMYCVKDCRLQEILLRIHIELNKLPGRELLMNDWKKFVNRAEYQIEKIYGTVTGSVLTEKCRELVLLEALAVYSGVRNREKCLEVVSEILGLNILMTQAMIDNRKVQVKTSERGLQVGIAPEILTEQMSTAGFSMNAYSARLLETLCSAVAFYENVLLIGETGCGKTSIIQYLARFTNTLLYVHNLSQTSEPTDIVGGFKPVAISSIMLPVLKRFLKIVDRFGSANNEIAHSKQLFAGGKWEKFLKSIESYISLQIPDKKIEKLKDLLDTCRKKLKNSQFAFQFVEGSLVRAIKEGSWVLLEEINLAEEEVLERLYSVLEGKGLTLIEKGETHSISPAPGFRLFGCMNPGKQIGKKDLPLSLRNKFTEVLVPDMEKFEDLMDVLNFYLAGKTDRKTMEKVVIFYLQMKKLSKDGNIEDGNGKPPCYTLRTLCRALKYALEFTAHYSFPHALYNGLKVFFETPLKTSISNLLEPLAPTPRSKSVLLENSHINVLGYYHERGPKPCYTDVTFILTPSVKANLQSLSRAVIYSNNAILLEGPTSSGKTSIIKYLAELLGHEFIRINNHEHTDIEEYIGSYVSDSQGRLVFCEGPLVKAVKNGYFLVLDELNLAPSEVLEALNRLLDDNQELFISETQITLKPHKNFRLFATQNPTAYAGRKELSKAFRNRFVEMFIPELPDDELVSILEIKGRMAPSYANVLIQVMRDLQRHRQQTRAFMGRYGFITIRDLLKIAKREPVGYEQLAHFAYVILAERLRTDEEKAVVKGVIEKYCKGAKICMEGFYLGYFEKHFSGVDCGVVWNFHMKRLFCLTHLAVGCKEPVLLIGETGCGKTSICAALAKHNQKVIRTLNCHQHIETSDFLGSLRPVRARFLLISAFFDELSKATGHKYENCTETEVKSLMQQIKTGEISVPDKKELLNKGKKCLKLFEWVDGPLVESFVNGDYLLIDEISLADDSVLERLNSVLESERKLLIPEKPSEDHLEMQAAASFAVFATMNPGGDYGKKELSPALRNRFTEIWVSLTPADMSEILKPKTAEYEPLLDFIQSYNQTARVPLSLRDAITCADFMNSVNIPNALQESLALILPRFNLQLSCTEVTHKDNVFGISPFYIKSNQKGHSSYSFQGPTILKNLYSLLRALQLPKAILLEGPPGVGKTSVVEALGKVTGKSIVRVNLSEETDLIDLLGCDLPAGNKFEWCDGVLLDAIKNGKWVILDELNLCPQQVVEGLNGLLDHRSSVFIPEINLEVKCADGFRLFAAQNPVSQGGGRKGLPKSFLNRFTKIYMEDLQSEDYLGILNDLFVGEENSRIVEFSQKMRSFVNGPWEFNLRDILREKLGGRLSTLYYCRLRSDLQQSFYFKSFLEVYPERDVDVKIPFFYMTPEYFYVNSQRFLTRNYPKSIEMIPRQMFLLERIIEIARQNWPVLLVGKQSCGKKTLVQLAACLLEKDLIEYSLSSNTDSSTLLGSFEQNEAGQFEWFDSFLVKAVKNGSWVLLKNCNKCNAAVLDRINSLLEPNGCLLINERGLVGGGSYIVTPHSDFRMFFAYNQSFGEVSRALRNRCVELYVDHKYSFIDFNRIFHMNSEEFSKVHEQSIGKVNNWKQLSEVVNRNQAFLLVFNEELMELEGKTLRYLKSINEFVENPAKAYFDEDFGFMVENGTQEAKECFLGGGCWADIESRCKLLNCPSLQAIFPSSDHYLPLVNINNSLELFLQISLALSGIQFASENLSALQALWLVNKSLSALGKHKFSKPLEKSKQHPSPLPSGLLKSYKSRKYSKGLAEIPKRPLLLTQNEFAHVIQGKTLQFPNKRTIVKVVDDEYNEVFIPVLASKESFQSEERVYLEEVIEVYEQVLFKYLLNCLDTSQHPKLNLVFYPQSYLKAVWMLNQQSYTLREVILPVLKIPSTNPTDFLEVFNLMKQVSIIDAPKMWTLASNMLKWPRLEDKDRLPARYHEELYEELQKCCEIDSKIEKVFTVSRSAAIGLWLYKLYIQLKLDPDQLQWDLKSDYESLVLLIRENVKTRLSYYAVRMGYEWENALVKFYKDCLGSFENKVNVMTPCLSPVHPDSAGFIHQLSAFPSYNRLSTLLTQEITPSSIHFLTDLVHSILQSIQKYSTHLILPLSEAIYLILYGLHSLNSSQQPVFEYPIPLSDYKDDQIISHLFATPHFLKTLTEKVINQTNVQVDSKNLAVKEIKRFATEHTVGEKTQEENEEERELNEKRQINKIFPSYKDEKMWNLECSKEQKVIVSLFYDWEFACGRLANEIVPRFLKTLPYDFSGTYLQKPLETHIKYYMHQYEESLSKFNFYIEPNANESMQIYTPLVQLLQRLTVLSQDFENHAIIQDLQHFIYKVLKRPIFQSPLMQLASMLEYVVQKAEDWESFAHSGISIKKEIAEIYAVLRRWRELQVKSWESILENVRKERREKEAKLWARLIRVIFVEGIKGRELYESLDEYVRGASLGTFEYRLELLQDFLGVVDEEQSGAVYHILKFYQSFLKQFQETFDEHYTGIEKKLKEILQIAKFKMSNYLTWKDSVAKTHKQLNSLVNKFKSVLKLPFETEILKKHRTSYEVNIIESGIKFIDKENLTGAYEELASTIFQRIEELKGLDGKTEKKLALTDLFKSLQTLGFSKFYKQCNLLIFDLPKLSVPNNVLDTSSHERYFYSCIDKMTVLQYTQCKTQDLLYEEKQVCLGLANSMLSQLFTYRSDLCSELFQYENSILLTPLQSDLVQTFYSNLQSQIFLLLQLKLPQKLSLPQLPKLTNTLLDIQSLLSVSSQVQALAATNQLSLPPNPPLNPVEIPPFHSLTAQNYRNLGKLTYIVLSILISLFTQGFCVPPELQESEPNGDGTGLGEGRGDQNITKELEDEEQFGETGKEDQNPENSSEISKENDAMDVREDFKEDQEEEAEGSGDDEMGKAEGNDQLIENDLEVEKNTEEQVRESANPDLADEQEVKAGEFGEDREGDVEDFDMQGKESEEEEDEEMKEEDSQDLMDVDKLSQEDSKDSESEEASKDPVDEAEDKDEEKKENTEKSQQQGLEEEEEEKKLEEFKNREKMQYESMAYGTDKLKANSEKVMDGGETSQEQGCDQNIISKLKSEWAKAPQGPSDIGPQSTESQATLTDVQVVNSTETLERPENSDLYTFTDSVDVAAAPSTDSTKPAPEGHLENPSKTETQVVETNDSISKTPQTPPPKSSDPAPKPLLSVPFIPGTVSYSQKPTPVPSTATLPPTLAYQVLPAPSQKLDTDTWLDLERQTAQISSELCEQLRIILEPTKAKSLKGDYKTGKRINMKKVIAYIASSYRKDKIWLRRTRQTAREYQVLLAIDDTYSMNQHGLGAIAQKGLAAIAQALNKLEVGQLAVGAIRGGLNIIHDFSTNFSPENGAFVLSELQFVYGKEKGCETCYGDFVNQCQVYLEERGRSDLQLVIVISDGRMNKDKVRPCLRRSEGVFYLFVIVDNCESSVLDMKSTVIMKKDGKSVVKVYPYLEDFPFEYYVVVQSSELLVGVLADVVKQWFELLRS